MNTISVPQKPTLGHDVWTGAGQGPVTSTGAGDTDDGFDHGECRAQRHPRILELGNCATGTMVDTRYNRKRTEQQSLTKS